MLLLFALSSLKELYVIMRDFEDDYDIYIDDFDSNSIWYDMEEIEEEFNAE